MTTVESPPIPKPAGADPGRGGRRRRPRPARRLLLVALVLLVLFPGVSYTRALAAPGGAGWQVQSVEWVRDHGGAPVVNWLENWWYARHPPSSAAPAAGSVPGTSAAGGSAGVGTAAPPGAAAPAPLPPLTGMSALPGEGRWTPGRLDAAGAPALYTTFVRPDPAHPSVLAGVAWMRASDTTGHLVAGLQQPGGGSWPGGGQISPSDVPSLVATFNSGWKFRDIDGGFYLDGRTGSPLRDGEASVVIDDQGRVTVGQWGRDVTMTAHVQAVRQNLALVVDGGRPVPGLGENGNGRWGSSHNQLQYTWRSGLGTDASGNLVYIAGNSMSLRELADAMAQAGIQRGMELDIHSRMVDFASWQPGSSGTPTPTKLLPDMPVPADRYLNPDQRDFFYLTLR